MMWLELMRYSTERSPDLRQAERAVAHPGSQDAVLLVAVLVTHAPGTWTDVSALRHARACWTLRPPCPRPNDRPRLKAALVNASDVDAARHP
ncbi:hypothetical protein ACF09H_22320 [Streptomyces sp. NPDC014983]|uniref:hypothetical protein n=1 Tax=Streptomyces sp. NPDC014983 TaxID=3364933 RepID=UPI0036F76581